MRRLLVGYSSRARIQAAQDFISAFAGQEMLLVAPTRQAADDIVRSLCIKNGTSLGVHRFTLASLAAEIASPRLAADGYSILSGVAIEALAARATERCRARHALQWFDPVARTPGFFRALASSITEVRVNDVDLDRLAASGPSGIDLANLVREFEAAMTETRVADLPMMYRVASTESSRYRQMPILLADVTPGSLLERRFIESLTSNAPQVLATAHCRNSRAIGAFEADLAVAAEPISETRSDALARLRSGVFSLRLPSAGEMDSSIEFRSASDESREATEISRSIVGLSRSGVSFDRVAILLRNPDIYQPLVEDALRRAGIPGFYTRGSKRPNPAGRAFLALLACASEDLSASRFGEYLSLGQVPDPEESTERPWVPIQGELFSERPVEPPPKPVYVDSVRAPQAWERLLVDAAVIGGYDRWERRLNGLDRELERQIQEVRAEDESRLLKLERQRARLQDLRRYALPLIDRLARLPQSAAWSEWLDALEQLAARALRQPEAVLSVIAELRPMSAVGPVTLDEVREVLNHRLTFLRTEAADRRYGKVFVATIAEIAGMAFDFVFLPGLGEDIFPKRVFEDPLMLDESRKTISEHLPVQDDRVADERFLFHKAAGSAELKLSISYPRMNLAQARPRGPSFYAMEVVRAATGHVPNLQELHRMAAGPSHSLAGWPAPRDHAVAIDDAEFDLALIGRLLHMQAQDARGSGRYLMTVNSHLARSLRNRAGRWRRRWTEGDGVVDADKPTLEILESQRISARPYSATALQQFAACPYRFLLSAVHRLQPRDAVAPLERMDALTRGSLFHSIQFHLLSELRSRSLLPITASNQAQVFELGDTVIDEVSEKYREELAPAIPRIWQGEVEDIRWDVRGWLREMVQPEGNLAWTPRWFELSFGLPKNRECDPDSAPAPVDMPGGLHLRGSIDMIEERDGGIRITDHKTGRAPAVPPGLTGRGEILQPVLYARAAEALLARNVDSARLFYCTERGGYRSIDVPVSSDAQKALELIIQTIDAALTEGFLPAAPREGACTWCDYRVVCGPYEEMRVRRKPADRLEPLKRIRT